MRVRMKRNPVPASAGWIARVTGKPEWIPTPKSAVWSRSVVCLATFILPSRTLPAARQWDAVGQTGDIGRIPAIGKAVHTRGQVRPRCPPTKTPLTWEAYRRSRVTPTHAFLPTVTTQAAAIGPASAYESGASEALACSWAGGLRGAPPEDRNL